MNYNDILNEFFGMGNDKVVYNENDCVLTLVVPGYGKEDFTIKAEDRKLHISAKDYERIFSLKGNYDINKIKAVCDKGILTITIPHKKASNSKLITVE